MGLDIRTLALIATGFTLLAAFAMALVWRNSPAIRGVSYWPIGAAMVAAGFLLIGLRDVVPPALSVIAANTVIILGAALIMIGIDHVLGFKPRRAVAALVVAATFASFVYFTLFDADIAARIITVSAAAFVLGALPAQRFAASFVRERRFVTLISAMVFALHSLFVAARGAYTAIAESGIANFMTAGDIHAAAFIDIMVWMFVITIIFATVTIRRLSLASEEILWGTDAGTWEWNVQTGETRFNDRWFEIVGYTAKELQPVTIETWNDLAHPDDLLRSAAALEDHFAGKTPFYECEARIRHKNGDWVWVLDRGKVVEWSAGGEPLRVSGTHMDIDTRKRNETLLAEAKATAESASAFKSQFLSTMSHEIRTPLNSIMGFSQLLDEDPDQPLTADQKRSVERIRRGGQHLVDLINDILDLTKIEAGKIDLSIEDACLTQILEECRNIVQPLADERGITLSSPPPGEGVWVKCDRTRLKQILFNLLSNAIKYNRPEGRVDIAVAVRNARMVEISVADTGLGIPPDRLAKLYEPFSRLGRENSGVEGTGIGLAITKSLTELMGGALRCDSRVGEGTVFRVVLPRGTTRDAADAAPATNGSAFPQLYGTLLYVEDNPANMDFMASIVARLGGVRLLEARSGESGIALANDTRPDLIVLDIDLPDISGLDVVERLKCDPALAETPVIALTAGATKEDMARGHAAGFRKYLTKPIRIDELTIVLAEFLRPGENETPGTTGRLGSSPDRAEAGASGS
jgi:PAS domain S-box-containing protein